MRSARPLASLLLALLLGACGGAASDQELAIPSTDAPVTPADPGAPPTNPPPAQPPPPQEPPVVDPPPEEPPPVDPPVEPPPPPSSNRAPTADAGPDAATDALASVTLQGRGDDAETAPGALGYRWQQLAGPAIRMRDSNAATLSFAAPDVAAEAVVRLRLTVTDDAGASASDEADVRVRPVLANLARYIDPRVGSFPPGFVNPGPWAPFGMVQPGPDTEGPVNYGGYSAQNALITGFSQVHMSAGAPKGGQFPLLPFTGSLSSGDLSETGYPNPVPAYAAPFDRKSEVAEAGYYRARLLRYGVTAELAASPRAALHRYTYGAGEPRRVLIDVSRDLTGYRPGEATLGTDGVLRGSVATSDRYTVYFALRAEQAYTAALADGTALKPGEPVRGDRLALVLDFAADSAPLQLKIGISYTDVAGALRNLDAEIAGWDFAALRAATRLDWERWLARALVEGGTEAQRTSFYTAFSRVLQYPGLHSDVDGRYRGPDGVVRQDTARPHYNQYSLWDSYRGQNQMLAEIAPDEYGDMVRSLLDFHDQAGYLPRWQQGPIDASHMSGDPAIPFIGEAYCRAQLAPAERRRALAAMQSLESARQARLARGYLPTPKPGTPFETLEGGPREAGTTLEYGVADFALALMADAEGERTEAARLAKASLNYRNLFDAESGFIRPRHEDGSWLTPFAPELGYGFQEGTSWQYSWLAMQDLGGLFERMGGNAAVQDKLDPFFNLPASLAPYAWPFVQNQITLFGLAYYGNQYAPGNEHDLHAPYLYNYAGAPWKTQIVARAAASLYAPLPNGLPGNDDLGALSGWLMWTLMGLYPMNPGTPLYVVGAPHFEAVTLRRPGAPLRITARGAGSAGFVNGLALDGQRLDRSWLLLPRGSAGVALTTTMLPDDTWAADSAPPSLSSATLADFGCRAE